MTPPNEVPMEAGETWIARCKLVKKNRWLFETAVSSRGELIAKATEPHHYYGLRIVRRSQFHRLDWHKIQLPEGWKV